MADKNHVVYHPKYKLHKSSETIDGGSCLCRHYYYYTEKNSCSYRWQGLVKAKEAGGIAIYNWEKIERKNHIGGKEHGYAKTGNREQMQRKPGFDLEVLEKDVDTVKGKKDLVKVNNFTTGFTPYGNQVHHVLNNSSLGKGINDVAKIYWPIRNVIVRGLLTEKYNLNHKDNNLIMPAESKAARMTGLPIHNGGHPNYSKKILKAVEKALIPYKKIAKQMKKKKGHDEPNPADLKDALELISSIMYKNLISLAKVNRRRGIVIGIDEIPKNSYRGL